LDAAAAGACAAFLRSLLKDCGLPKTLSPCGLNGEALPHLAGIAAANRSALLNVRRAGADQVAELYRSCL
jgi:alcohol dehydrogenase class IV